MDDAAARAFAADWLARWNSHDLELILEHYAEDVTFTSPRAVALAPGSGGVVRGKDALRRYWSAGLRALPDLRFELIEVYSGVDTVVINYRNERGVRVSEVLRFDGPLVIEGHGTYSEPVPDRLGEERQLGLARSAELLE